MNFLAVFLVFWVSLNFDLSLAVSSNCETFGQDFGRHCCHSQFLNSLKCSAKIFPDNSLKTIVNSSVNGVLFSECTVRLFPRKIALSFPKLNSVSFVPRCAHNCKLVNFKKLNYWSFNRTHCFAAKVLLVLFLLLLFFIIIITIVMLLLFCFVLFFTNNSFPFNNYCRGRIFSVCPTSDSQRFRRNLQRHRNLQRYRHN